MGFGVSIVLVCELFIRYFVKLICVKWVCKIYYILYVIISCYMLNVWVYVIKKWNFVVFRNKCFG